MSIFKCKMCGGALEINNGETVAACEYCGTQQTLPKLDDDKRVNMYDRANHFRRNNEFDKAMGIYENILNEDNTDAEAYWSLVLCRYGIEYVEDPSSHKRIPTVNRAQFTSIFDDDNYKSALQYADSYQRTIYEEEARAINEIQKGILAISQKEEPFDVFICYKESDNNGRRTPDSVLANDLYHQLTQEGFKVFFARITLEDKLGSAYEPYIFAALNSAKVMVVLGTKPEYFNAVWVKNEWSRYLALIKQGQKKMLIPAYKDMDPYDLPEEFSHLQAQDMGKLGFMQDLIRGIKKIAQADTPKTTVVKETVISGGNTNTAPLLKRAFMFLEDGDWNSANEYCEKVLDIDPENAQAYLGKLMAELGVRKQENLKDCEAPFENSNNFQKAVRFADDELRNTLNGYITHIKTRNENSRLEAIYSQAINILNYSRTHDHINQAQQLFLSIKDYKDAAELAKECDARVKALFYANALNMLQYAKSEDDFNNAKRAFFSIEGYRDASEMAEKCEDARKDFIYNDAVKQMATSSSVQSYTIAIEKFRKIKDWKDSEKKIKECKSQILKIEEKERKQAKEKKVVAIITVLAIIIAFVAFFVVKNVVIPNKKYNDAIALMDAGKYDEAITAFEAMDGYKDSDDKIEECKTAILDEKYNNAVALMDAGKFDEAITAFEAMIGYKDSDGKIEECKTAILDEKYNNAVALMDAGKYTEAITAFEALDGYKGSANKITECNTAILDGKYNDAIALMDAENIVEAYEALVALDGYKDSAEKASSIFNKYFTEKYKNIKDGEYLTFGKYEQDNNTSNGKEDIEWLVLEVKDGKVLVISKYALDCKQYNTSYTDVTWETCTLRKWLNNDFLGAAFSDVEKAMIPTVTVSADKNPNYSTKPGKATQDQVFLLSITEANEYFSYNGARQCKPTSYADENGAYIDSNANCWWWLRSPGSNMNLATRVDTIGAVGVNGNSIDNNNIAVRPALWISLE